MGQQNTQSGTSQQGSRNDIEDRRFGEGMEAGNGLSENEPQDFSGIAGDDNPQSGLNNMNRDGQGDRQGHEEQRAFGNSRQQGDQ